MRRQKKTLTGFNTPNYCVNDSGKHLVEGGSKSTKWGEKPPKVIT